METIELVVCYGAGDIVRALLTDHEYTYRCIPCFSWIRKTQRIVVDKSDWEDSMFTIKNVEDYISKHPECVLPEK